MKTSLKAVAAAGGFFLGSAGIAIADTYRGPGFSGTAWVGENGSQPTQQGNVQVSDSGFRMNMEVQGQKISVLVKWESDIVWSLIHSQKMFMEMPPDQSGMPPYEAKPCAGYKNGEKQGSETLNGRVTEKWRCTEQTTMLGGEQPSDATVWYDPELEFDLKTADDTGNVFEIRDVKVGAQDDSMFEVPAGYKIFDMEAMMLQMQQ